MIVNPKNGPISDKIYHADAKTAGSIGLIAQIALPVIGKRL